MARTIVNIHGCWWQRPFRSLCFLAQQTLAKLLQSGSGWTLHHHHPGTVNFYLFSDRVIFMPICFMLFALFRFGSEICLEKNSFSHLRLRLQLSDENRLAEVTGSFRLSICSSSYPFIIPIFLPRRCLPRKLGHETQTWHANKNAMMTITTTRRRAFTLFFLMTRYIYLLNGDLIRLAFAFLCIFLESQTLLM